MPRGAKSARAPSPRSARAPRPIRWSFGAPARSLRPASMTLSAPLAPSAPLPRRVLVFLVALYAACVIATALTRDFGFYFDDKLHVEPVRVTWASGVLLPRYYHYPSLGYLISMLASLPSLAAHGFDRQALAAELAE